VANCGWWGRRQETLVLRDVAPDGTVLLAREARRLEMAGRLGWRRGGAECIVARLVGVQEVSPGGAMVLFDESGEAVGWKPTAYLYRNAITPLCGWLRVWPWAFHPTERGRCCATNRIRRDSG